MKYSVPKIHMIRIHSLVCSTGSAAPGSSSQSWACAAGEQPNIQNLCSNGPANADHNYQCKAGGAVGAYAGNSCWAGLVVGSDGGACGLGVGVYTSCDAGGNLGG